MNWAKKYTTTEEKEKYVIGLVKLSVSGTYIACQEAGAHFLPVGVKDAAVFVQVTLPL